MSPYRPWTALHVGHAAQNEDGHVKAGSTTAADMNALCIRELFHRGLS